MTPDKDRRPDEEEPRPGPEENGGEADEARTDGARPDDGAQDAAREWKDKYLRALADLDNYRKRMERDRLQSRRYAVETLLRELLPAVDHFEMAVRSEGDAEAIRKGVRLALDELMRVLTDKGLEPIEAVGEPFDPRVHEAVGMEMDPEREPNRVSREERRGYRFHDRVLRPSRVHIVVAPPASSGEDGPPDDAGDRE